MNFRSRPCQRSGVSTRTPSSLPLRPSGKAQNGTVHHSVCGTDADVGRVQLDGSAVVIGADPAPAFQHPIHDLNCQSGNLDVLLQGRSTFRCWEGGNRRRARIQKFDDRIGRTHAIRFFDFDKSVTRFGPGIELKVIKGSYQINRICRKPAAGKV